MPSIGLNEPIVPGTKEGERSIGGGDNETPKTTGEIQSIETQGYGLKTYLVGNLRFDQSIDRHSLSDGTHDTD